jgi:hypothetical protein
VLAAARSRWVEHGGTQRKAHVDSSSNNKQQTSCCCLLLSEDEIRKRITPQTFFNEFFIESISNFHLFFFF